MPKGTVLEEQKAAEHAAEALALGEAERCGNCRFFKQTPKKLWGRCHRFPPHAVLNDRAQLGPNEWCGEFENGAHPHDKAKADLDAAAAAEAEKDDQSKPQSQENGQEK